jgi:hypothetical protein
LRETAILTKSLVHETRFEYRTDPTPRPDNIGGCRERADSFFAGGAIKPTSNNNRVPSSGPADVFESKWTMKTGVQGTYRMDRTRSENNFL